MVDAININEWAANGLRAIQIGGVDELGRFMGFGNLTSLDEGEMSGMRRIKGAVTAPTPLPETTTVYNRGDDGYIAGYDYDGQPSAYGLVFEATDLDVAAYVAKKALWALGRWNILNSGNSNQQKQNVACLLTRQAQSLAAASSGSPGYDNLLIMSNKFTRRRGDAAHQSAGQITLSGIANRVRKTLWNAELDTLFDDTDGITWEFWSAYPTTFFTFVGDAVIDDIPLPYMPVNDVAAVKLFNGTTGAAITTTAVSDTADTATVAAAPAEGLMVIGMMETPEI